MFRQKKNKTGKNVILHLPVWCVVMITAVCIATGILIGSRINKPDAPAEPQKPETTQAAESSTGTTKPKIDKTQWNLILVNKWNPIPEGYEVKLTQLKSGHAVDERAYPELQQMMDDCRAEGLDPVICSSYRTNEKQTKLFNRKINQYKDMGYSDAEAEKLAGEIVAVPGTSEHQLGLALDIVDESYQTLDEKQEETAVQKWLMANCWKYGFILRYPTDKRDITGITYEPWHYRYVGKEAAADIYKAGICLEEYLNS